MRIALVKNIQEAKDLIRRVGADDLGIEIMAPKAIHRVLYIKEISIPAALILKQEMLARGGEAAINRQAIVAKARTTDVVLMGTLQQYRQALIRLKQQPFGLKKLAEEMDYLLEMSDEPNIPVDIILTGKDLCLYERTVLRDRTSENSYQGLDCRGKWLPLGQRTLVMGIINLTPDSFSDGGQYNLPELALQRAHDLVSQGADIIDVGAESTRPGSKPISAEEEWQRLKKTLPLLIKELPVPISLDTYKAEVARKALDFGINMINDIWGLRRDSEMARVIADYGVPVIVMHNREKAEYQDLMAEIVEDLGLSLQIAEKAGIDKEKIIVDPGIGFGKTVEHNLEIIKHLSEIKSLGKPILLGTSRKSFIGRVLGVPVEQRLEGTIATVVMGITAGVDIVRVHDVKQIVPAVKMSDAIVRYPGKKFIPGGR